MKCKPLIVCLSFFTVQISFAETALDRQTKKLEDFALSNKVGQQDFWLQMETTYGWESTALVFGYWNDYDACLDIKKGLEALYSRRYRCIPANKED